MSGAVTKELALRLGVPAVAATEVWATRSLGGPLALTAGCLAVAALPLCRRRPLPVLFATLPALSLGYVWLAPMTALYWVAQLTGRVTVVASAALVALVSFVPWPHLGPVSWSPSSVALALMFSGMLAGPPVVLARLVATRRELQERMAELMLARVREHTLTTQQTVLHERARLSRDIHDTVAHHLSLISLQAGALERTVPPDRRQDAVLVRRASQAAMADLRRLVELLRSPAAGAGAPPAVLDLDLATLVAAAGPRVTASLADLDRAHCPPAVREAAFRIVQEALTNIRKHAPGAGATVTVEAAAEGLEVRVVNTPGTGTPQPSVDGDGRGIQGMRERAAAVGGRLEAHRLDDGGFAVRALLPLPVTAAPDPP